MKRYYVIFTGITVLISIVYINVVSPYLTLSLLAKKNNSDSTNTQSSRYLLTYEEETLDTEISPSLHEAAKIEPTDFPSNNFISSSLDAVNRYRNNKGLDELKEHTVVCQFAMLRLQEVQSDFSHNGFTRRRDSDLLPYSSFRTVVENIARVPSGDAIELWQNSPSHEENLRADVEYGCIREDQGFVVFEGWKPE